MEIGRFALLLFPLLVALGIAVVFIASAIRRQRRIARAAGYASLREYLRAAPRTDREKKDAADLALKGLVICVLGLLFPPVILVGVFPLFYGARKLLYAEMGLGLVDDEDAPRQPTGGA